YRQGSFERTQLVPLLGAWEGSASVESSYIQLLSPENKLRSRKVREVTAFLLDGFGSPAYWDEAADT
ncbi:hypothetical protein, partial [Microbacterium sp.]